MEEADLEREWEKVLASWSDPKAHERFLVLADASGSLGLAGRRYRDVRESDPERAAEAARRIDDVLARAMSQMRVQRVEPAERRKPIEWIAIGISAALLAAMVWQLLRAF